TLSTVQFFRNIINFIAIVDTSHVLDYFFFHHYEHDQILHSFPTRRSSDLVTDLGSWCLAPGYIDLHTHGFHGHENREYEGQCSRSEEHTSELQSPYDLVCRLLLEKKKLHLEYA